jgi:hypothetical protein
MTKQGRRQKALVKRGYFKSEQIAWSGFDFKDAPWWAELRKARSKIVRQWASRHKVDLKTIEPLDLRRSLSYQKMVRKWYEDQGWIKARTRYGRKTYRIDPYAAMRWYADNYHKSPEGKGKVSPWKKRQVSRSARRTAIDKRFSTAPGLTVL